VCKDIVGVGFITWRFISAELINIVAYLLKARTVETEKQPLLANDSETTFVSRQRTRNNGMTSVGRRQILNK
jgi:hypothetical protein